METSTFSQLPRLPFQTKHLHFRLRLPYSFSSPSPPPCRTTSKPSHLTVRTSCIRPVRRNAKSELDSGPHAFNAADEEEEKGVLDVVSAPSSSASSFISEELNGGAKFLGIWGQAKEIVRFAGPAVGLWICGPLMSLIDTAVIGQGSSLELAALGPGTVVCDNTSYAFMFLSIATSNMVATALAKKDNNLLQHQISMLLFIAFACGMGMLFFTKFMGTQMIMAFTGPKNLHMVPAANTYVQIRGLAWPAILVGLVAQSARFVRTSDLEIIDISTIQRQSVCLHKGRIVHSTPRF